MVPAEREPTSTRGGVVALLVRGGRLSRAVADARNHAEAQVGQAPSRRWFRGRPTLARCCPHGSRTRPRQFRLPHQTCVFLHHRWWRRRRALLSRPMLELSPHSFRIKGQDTGLDEAPDAAEYAERIRSWLTALLGAEHLSILVGSGLSIAIASATGARGLSMDPVTFAAPNAEDVDQHARRTAEAAHRGEPNIEDQLRSALQLVAGLEVLGSSEAVAWRSAIDDVLREFAVRGLQAEEDIRNAIESDAGAAGQRGAQLLVSFLLAFASRSASRERTTIFTTNYDRLIEYGCDLGGLRVIDRFVGSIEPVFRASRLEVDLHYNPPGIRGEPRYLEGVVRLSKLHGSLDWRFEKGRLVRMPLAIGGPDPILAIDALDRLMIYPNAAKDVGTLEFPYAELFRDFSSAICRPNGVLVTFGYGFGDSHINRIIRDMLTLRSTHLLVIAFGDPGNRTARFLGSVAPEQYSLLYGSHFGDLGSLVDNYLPQPGSEEATLREAERARALADGASA